MSIVLMNVENMWISARAFCFLFKWQYFKVFLLEKTIMAFGVYDTVYGMQHVYFSSTKPEDILEQQLKEQK